MTIRVLVTGPLRANHRQGYWTKARQHNFTKSIRFERKHGKGQGFTGEAWRFIYREDTQVGAQAWVEQMARDEILRAVAFNINVRVPEKYARDRVLEDIEAIGDEMERAQRKGTRFPMTRSACDDPIKGPCPLQAYCLAQRPMEDPGETGMFMWRKNHVG